MAVAAWRPRSLQARQLWAASIALIALEKWPGDIKVIGPISSLQEMAVGFSKDSPQLRAVFNKFLKDISADGTYLKLVLKYYPSILQYYENYFLDYQKKELQK